VVDYPTPPKELPIYIDTYSLVGVSLGGNEVIKLAIELSCNEIEKESLLNFGS